MIVNLFKYKHLRDIIIVLYLLLFLFSINKKQAIKMKVCICTIGKLENPYIREYVEYYKKLGVDNIFIYDNNEINGESFETVLFDYLVINYVKIINVRGYKKPQYKVMNNCYNKTYLKYDWIMFYDIDEYLYLKNYNNIKKYLIQDKFNKCKLIYLNFKYYTDNNNLYYANKSLVSRFKNFKVKDKYFGKSIIRGNISKIRITSCHILTRNIKPCDGFGNFPKKYVCDYKYYYIKHYSFKSTEEYCKKINKGNAVYGDSILKKIKKIKMYFQFNEITIEKINLIENKTGINLDFLRNKSKMNNK